MGYMIGDFFETFDAYFAGTNVYLMGQEYPAGYFASAFLNVEKETFERIRIAGRDFLEEFEVYLTARTISAGGMAQQAMEKLYRELSSLPGYQQLNPPQQREYAPPLLRSLRAYPEEADLYITLGTKERESMLAWQKRIKDFPWDMEHFQMIFQELMQLFFNRQYERTPFGYAKLYAGYCRDKRKAREYIDSVYYSICDDEEDLPWDIADYTKEDIVKERREKEIEFKKRYPFEDINAKVTYRLEGDPKDPDKIIIAEVFTFEHLEDFIKMDFMQGLSVGHIPRICANCGRYFLLDHGYDTRYCNEIDPKDPSHRTCRVVGAKKTMMRKGPRKRGAVKLSDGVVKEYTRAYNRLKKRHARGGISDEEWSFQAVKLRDMRDAAAREEISVKQLREYCAKV